MIEFRLQPGDTIVFNNRRTLHARSAFEAASATSNRVLHGCYVNVDEFASKYRYLCELLGKKHLPVSVANHSYADPKITWWCCCSRGTC